MLTLQVNTLLQLDLFDDILQMRDQCFCSGPRRVIPLHLGGFCLNRNRNHAIRGQTSHEIEKCRGIKLIGGTTESLAMTEKNNRPCDGFPSHGRKKDQPSILNLKEKLSDCLNAFKLIIWRGFESLGRIARKLSEWGEEFLLQRSWRLPFCQS